MTSSGIIGVVKSVSDDRLSLEIAPDTIIEIMKTSVANVLDDEKKVAKATKKEK